MPLTSEELADVDKLLGQMEKNARTWRVRRWLLIGAAVLNIGLAVWAFMTWQNAWNTAMLREPSDNVTGFALLLERVTVMSLCTLNMFAIVLACLGAWFLVISLANWNKGKRDGLLIKLARSYADGQRHRTEGIV